MVSWVDKLRLDVEQIENNVSGAYGYSFFPAACLPGSFARLPGWSRFQNYKLDSTVKASGSTRDWGGSGGLNLGLFSIRRVGQWAPPGVALLVSAGAIRHRL